MRKALLGLAVLIAGCTGEDAKEASASVTTTPAENVQLAGKAVRTEGIALSWNGNAAHVGDAWETAQRVFPERRASYPLRALPARFGRDFQAHGWETNDGQGYGVITHDDLVVAAVYHAEDVEADDARSLFEAQRAGTGALPMRDELNGPLDWDFWESGSQRLMVLREKGKRGTDVTILVGDDKVLDALGATLPASTAPLVAPFTDRPSPNGESISRS